MLQDNPDSKPGPEQTLEKMYAGAVWMNDSKIGSMTFAGFHRVLSGLKEADPFTGDVCGIAHDFTDGDTCGYGDRLYCPHDDFALRILETGINIAAKIVGEGEVREMRTALRRSKQSLEFQDNGAQIIRSKVDGSIGFLKGVLPWAQSVSGVSDHAIARSTPQYVLPIIEEAKCSQRKDAKILGNLRDAVKTILTLS